MIGTADKELKRWNANILADVGLVTGSLSSLLWLIDGSTTILDGNSEFDLDVDQIWTKNAFWQAASLLFDGDGIEERALSSGVAPGLLNLLYFMYKFKGMDTTNCGILRNIFFTTGAIFLKLLNVLVRTPKPSNVHCFCHWIWILHDLTSMRRGTWHWLESQGAKKLSRYLLTLGPFARQNQQHPKMNQLWLHDGSCEKYQQQCGWSPRLSLRLNESKTYLLRRKQLGLHGLQSLRKLRLVKSFLT